MRKFLLIAASVVAIGTLTAASGCTMLDSIFGTGSQASKTVTVQVVIDACDAFQLALQGATLARQAKSLSPAVVAKVDALIPPVQNICPPKSQMPTGPIDALVTVVTNTAAIIAAVKGGQ